MGTCLGGSKGCCSLQSSRCDWERVRCFLAGVGEVWASTAPLERHPGSSCCEILLSACKCLWSSKGWDIPFPHLSLQPLCFTAADSGPWSSQGGHLTPAWGIARVAPCHVGRRNFLGKELGITQL